MVISDKFISEIKSELVSNPFYTLTKLAIAVELCIAGNAPMAAAIYYNAMREKVKQLMEEDLT